MEKIRIQISKGYLVTLLFLMLGLLYLSNGVKAYFDSEDAVLLSELKFNECTKGQYVCGSIESCVTKKIGKSYYGECTVWITGTGAEYHCYTIPTADNKYIRIMVKDKMNVDALEEFVQGQGEGVYIEGEILEMREPLNYEWYKGVEGWKDEVLEEIVQPDYIIKEINFRKKIKQIYIGIVFLISAVGCFVLSGGIGIW